MQRQHGTSTAPISAATVAFRLGSTALIALTTLVACPLDERTLHPMPTTNGSGGNGGSAGASETDSGNSSTDSGGASATGTHATASGSTSTTTGLSLNGSASGVGGTGTGGNTNTGEAGAGNGDPGCPDLDQNSVADCEETLVENGSFDANLNAWHEETNALGSWEQEDALDHDISGSASIVNRTFYEDREGQVMRGLWQCVPARAEKTYQLLTQVRIIDDEGQAWGGINVWFYDGPDCTGTPVTASTPLLGTTTDWSHTESKAESPAGTKSMLVRLVVNKPFSSPAIAVDFDNVLIREE